MNNELRTCWIGILDPASTTFHSQFYKLLGCDYVRIKLKDVPKEDIKIIASEMRKEAKRLEDIYGNNN